MTTSTVSTRIEVERDGNIGAEIRGSTCRTGRRRAGRTAARRADAPAVLFFRANGSTTTAT